MDPVRLGIFRDLLASVAEEMGKVLERSSFSPNIRERRDFSCALFDENGEMVVEAAHLPVHLGSLPLSVGGMLREIELAEGDVGISNDPFRGGTHLPDITLLAPGFAQGRRLFYVAARAHHADLGGASPGSMSPSTEIFQEGLIIPPLKLVEKGALREDILRLILSNTRTPEERRGDIMAQLAAIRRGVSRMEELVRRYGAGTLREAMRELQDYAERVMRSTIREIPDGVYEFEDFLDDDGAGEGPVRIKVRVEIRGDEALVDFSGTSPQVRGNVNAPLAVTCSAVFYVFRCLVGEDIPFGSGMMRPIEIKAPPQTVVNASPPAAVAAGNVETSQRIVDALLGALSSALPERIPAASCGTMNNLAVGGMDPKTKRPFAYYETIGGGSGAGPGWDGASAVHCHMTNTQNTPVEELERSFPLRVKSYRIRRGSGGEGRFRGGDGIIREIELLAESHISILSERRRFAPWGLRGGSSGKPGRNILKTKEGERELPSKASFKARPGEVIRIETPGGGGFGAADRRSDQ